MAGEARKRVIIDTNIFFSSIFYPEGNERRLFELADLGICQIIIFDYVLEEIQMVLERKGIEPGLAMDLLDTYKNIIHMELEPPIYHQYLDEASKIVRDKKDWPIYIFAKHVMNRHSETYLVSGDKHLNSKKVREALDRRVLRTKEFLDILVIP